MKNMMTVFDGLDAEKMRTILSTGLHGLERETLRTQPDGKLAMTEHPHALSDPLTDSEITTDFSESQVEMVTPPFATIEETMKQLEKTHARVVNFLEDEYVWPFSMPCILPAEDEIPLAQYGDSEVAKDKEIYRKGLSLRTGKHVQMICGVHYNISFADELWDLLYDRKGKEEGLQAFKNEQMLGMVRRFYKYGWLVAYCTSASPVRYAQGVLEEEESCVMNLRLGRNGYINKAPLDINYCSFENHVASLEKAIETPYAPYAAFGLFDADGKQHQLNTNVLQLANEYYAPLRMKPVPHKDGYLAGLKHSGVAYAELRLLDVNPFCATGVDVEALRLSHIFLLWCLLNEEPCDGFKKFDSHQKARLDIASLKMRPLEGASLACAKKHMAEMKELAVFFPAEYGQTLEKYDTSLTNPVDLPWHKVWMAMEKNGHDFVALGLDLAKKHKQFFTKKA